jgi:hypothetical protein
VAITCLLCDDKPEFTGLFVPDDQRRFGAPPGKTRAVVYALCGAGAERPDKAEGRGGSDFPAAGRGDGGEELTGVKTGERFTLTIDALAEPTPAPIRLRAVLKALLRHYGFRCVEVREGAAAASGDEVLRLRRRVEELAGKAPGPPVRGAAAAHGGEG